VRAAGALGFKGAGAHLRQLHSYWRESGR